MFNTHKKTPSFVHFVELIPFSGGDFQLVLMQSHHYRRAYNAILGHLKKQLQLARHSQEWKAASSLKKNNPQRAKQFQELKKKFGLTEANAQVYGKKIRNNRDFNRYTNSAVLQKIAVRAFSAIEKVMYGKASRVRFKTAEEKMSFEGRQNTTGIRFLQVDSIEKTRYGRKYNGENHAGYIVEVNGVYLKPQLDLENPYVQHALKSRVKYNQVLFKTIHGKERIFLKMVLAGIPFEDKKKAQHYQELLRKKEGESYESEKQEVAQPYREVVAYDVGPKMIAVSTAITGWERPLCEKITQRTAESKRIQRKMERSKISLNPDYYDEKGRCKKGKKEWKYSKHYIQLRKTLASLHRNQAEHRKSLHGALANEILSYGRIVKMEKVSYKGWQKRYGKSMKQHAPSALQSILTRKAENARGRYELINTYETALSQHCLCGRKEKKELSQRKHVCQHCGLGQSTKISRDLFSAYLAVFSPSEIREGKVHSSVDLESARQHFPRHRTLSMGAPCALAESAKEKIESVSLSRGEQAPVDFLAQKSLTFT